MVVVYSSWPCLLRFSLLFLFPSGTLFLNLGDEFLKPGKRRLVDDFFGLLLGFFSGSNLFFDSGNEIAPVNGKPFEERKLGDRFRFIEIYYVAVAVDDLYGDDLSAFVEAERSTLGNRLTE